jgi:lysozyme family protein
MASIGIPRRTLLGWGASLIALETATSRAAAREPELFGLKLPGEVSRLLPSEAIDAIGIVETLIRLERAADDAKLPATPLRFDGDLSPAALAGSLYRSLMPRLVALIDRSQRIDPKLADQAGALLAQLHGAEHEIPDLLRGFAPGSDQQLDGDGNGPLSLAPPTFDNVGDNVGDNASDVVAPGRRTLWARAAPPVAKKPAPPPLSRARKYPALKDEYRRLFDEMTLRPNYSASTDWYLTMLKTSRPSYDRVALDTGVPWFVIGIIHGLEASFNFLAHLHNGDHPLTGRTRKVPAGRPLTWAPPTDWDWSAKDALKLLGFTGKTDWNLERILFRFEAYNGFGYRNTAVPTPYLWSFSNHYEAGKFVADGRFNAKAKSQQCGAAVMLKLLVDAGEISL